MPPALSPPRQPRGLPPLRAPLLSGAPLPHSVSRPPQTLEELSRSLQLHETLQQELPRIEAQIPPIHEQFAILEKYEVAVDEEVGVGFLSGPSTPDGPGAPCSRPGAQGPPCPLLRPPLTSAAAPRPLSCPLRSRCCSCWESSTRSGWPSSSASWTAKSC